MVCRRTNETLDVTVVTVRRVGSVTQHGERWVNYNQVIKKCNPAVINSILGDFFVCHAGSDLGEEPSHTM